MSEENNDANEQNAGHPPKEESSQLSRRLTGQLGMRMPEIKISPSIDEFVKEKLELAREKAKKVIIKSDDSAETMFVKDLGIDLAAQQAHGCWEMAPELPVIKEIGATLQNTGTALKKVGDALDYTAGGVCLDISAKIKSHGRK